MARNVIDGTGWLVENRDSTLAKAYGHESAVDAEFRPVNMTANTVRIPRISDMSVEVIPKGGAYPEDQSSADTVLLTAAKIGAALRIAEEDAEDDKLADYVEEKKGTAGSSFAKLVDNAGLGAVGTENGTTRPFTSLYQRLSTADAATGYTANANKTSGATFGYDQLSALLERVEVGNYFNADDIVAIAHPAFRRILRDAKDGQGRPIFLSDYTAGRQVDTVLGVRIRYTTGARVSATATVNPNGVGGAAGAAGNPLFAVVQKQLAVVGRRKALESVVIPGRDGLSALTDEDILKVRGRVAVGYTVPGAHALFERTSA